MPRTSKPRTADPASAFRAPIALLLAMPFLAMLATSCAVTSRAVDTLPDMPLLLVSGDLAMTVLVDADSGGHVLVVDDARTGIRWTADGTAEIGTVVGAARTGPSSYSLRFLHPVSGQPFTATGRVDGDAHALFFTVAADDLDAPFEWVNYPPVFHGGFVSGELVFTDRSSGVYLAQDDMGWYADDPGSIYGRPLLAWGNTQSLDMPWWGTIDTATGAGAVQYFNTPTDAIIRFESTADDIERYWARPIWLPTLGTFGYEREFEVHFTGPGGGAVALAKKYREIAEREGRAAPLKERAVDLPEINFLAGSPVIWGADSMRFLRQARTLGITHAVLSGRFAPSAIRQMNAWGYLTNEYENLQDINEGPRGPFHDDVLAAAYIDESGEPLGGWVTLEGNRHSTRSSINYVEVAQLFMPEVQERIGFNSRFVDVNAALQLFEDWRPGAEFGRAQDLEYRADLFRYLAEFDLVIGTEHPNDWAVPHVHYGEGQLSGPFWWEGKSGHLVPFDSRDDIPARYYQYAVDPAKRLPIWDLVYHDSLVMSWYWGDSNGYMYNVDPGLSDFKDALNILHGQPSMMWASELGYGWDRNRDRFLETARVTMRWVQSVAFEGMTGFRHVTGDRAVQETTFGNGARAIVNLSGEPRTVEWQAGEEVLLAPFGYVAESPAVRQRSVLVGGERLIVIEAVDGVFVDSPTAAGAGPVTGAGRLHLFPLPGEEGRWNLVVEEGGPWRLDLSAVPDFPSGTPLRLVELDINGRIVRDLGLRQGNELEIPATAGQAVYGVLGRTDAGHVVLAPQGGEIPLGTPITMTAATAATVRYTLDGTVPTASSAAFDEPLVLQGSATITARAFVDGVPVGSPVSAGFTPVAAVHDTGVIRGAEGLHPASIDLGGARALRMVVTDAGDGLAYDGVILAEPVFVTNDGRRVRLGDMPGVESIMHGHYFPDLAMEDAEWDGREFAHAAFFSGRGEATVPLDGDFATFETAFYVPQEERRGSVQVLVEILY